MDYIRTQLMAGQQEVSPSEVQAIAKAYLNANPDAPLLEQYIDYMSSMLVGDFGVSLYYGDPVSEILATAVPWTVFLMMNSLLIAFTVGISLGATMAYLEQTRFDNAMTVIGIVSNSIPYYAMAILLIYVLGFIYGVFPVTGRYDDTTNPGANLPFIRGVVYHAFLPVSSWVFAAFGGWALSMRGNSIQVLGADYMRVGRLRGLPPHRLALRYVARNAILPLYTSLMIGIGYAFGGAVVLETIFVYRGLGYYLFQGVTARDYPMMMGVFILICVAVVTALILAEITYGKLDPRAAEGGTHESY